MYTMDELNDKLLSELKNITEELGIKGASKLSKQDLIYKILDEQAISKPKKSSAKKDKPESKSSSKAKSNEFLDDAKSKIEIEKKKAIKEIKEEVVDLSLELATKVLQRNVKDDDNSKFIKSSLEAVKVDEAKS